MREPKEIILSKGQTLAQELRESCPDLGGEDLSGADLTWAVLIDANLEGADLRDANLSHANLLHTNLIGAKFHGAILRYTRMGGSDLREAENIISIGPIGSRGDMLYAVQWDNGPMVKTGRFWGTLEEFAAAVLKTHGKPADSRVSDEYRRAIDLISTWGSSAKRGG